MKQPNGSGRNRRRGASRYLGSLAGVLLLMAGGCTSPATPSHHALSPLAALSPAAPIRQPLILSMEPVTLPELIDQRHVVIRMADGRLQLSPSHCWAGSLRDDIAHVLAENLGILLGGAVTVLPPADTALIEPDVRLALAITRLEARAGKGVELVASWGLRETNTGNVQVSPPYRLCEPVAEDSVEAIVAAHNRLLAALSRDMAQALRQLVDKP